MPQWNTTERGKTRDDAESDKHGDYDGLSDMDIEGIPGGPLRDGRDVEEYMFGMDDEDES